jgi:hypothetical protein
MESPFTFAVLIERNNVDVGLSYIVEATSVGMHSDDVSESEVLTSGTLQTPRSGG